MSMNQRTSTLPVVMRSPVGAEMFATFADRNARIRRLVAGDWEPIELAAEFGISRERVRQIVHREHRLPKRLRSAEA